MGKDYAGGYQEVFDHWQNIKTGKIFSAHDPIMLLAAYGRFYHLLDSAAKDARMEKSEILEMFGLTIQQVRTHRANNFIDLGKKYLEGAKNTLNDQTFPMNLAYDRVLSNVERIKQCAEYSGIDKTSAFKSIGISENDLGLIQLAILQRTVKLNMQRLKTDSTPDDYQPVLQNSKLIKDFEGNPEKIFEGSGYTLGQYKEIALKKTVERVMPDILSESKFGSRGYLSPAIKIAYQDSLATPQQFVQAVREGMGNSSKETTAYLKDLEENLIQVDRSEAQMRLLSKTTNHHPSSMRQ